MAQQTAVQRLIDQLKELYNNEGKLPLVYTFELLKQAKQMEKEQIVKAWELRATPYPTEGMGYSIIDATGEQYYNETYGK